ncbi:hypothetical protein FC99_GL001821 [Levilactobacillus koreensis JCM 16448]|uniref:Glycosyltransferase 2-like domain-containing protein n=1 Tax=Levilactobacillus koreensis TaxID=637971 RepID=A0AAC9ER77_9LACO|nr:glycosyltransferase family 2 protein [Levilactobacillus koreensis]AKP65339.1 hypothetical protein ABN16_10215 [Levilactobacillus koreensis]KRK86074.1 hypothetical protein FC99_GL001821 [Levilactobacillus koreensis JCM 16448]
MNALTVIVPVHNSVSTLNRCFKSICLQTFKDFLVIIVDDGSTDGSNALCQKWVEKDSRFHLYNNYSQKKGASAARNMGLAHVTTPWVTFIDSDDWIEKYHFENLMNNLGNSDIGVSSFTSSEQEVVARGSAIQNLSHDELLCEVLGLNLVSGYLWNKIFKLEIIRENNISFDENAVLSEDLEFVVQYSVFCNQGFFIKSPKSYHYIRRNDSLTRNKNGEVQKYCDEYRTVKRIRNSVRGENNVVKNAAKSHYAITANNLYNVIKKSEQRNNYKEQMSGLRVDILSVIIPYTLSKQYKFRNKASAWWTLIFGPFWER